MKTRPKSFNLDLPFRVHIRLLKEDWQLNGMQKNSPFKTFLFLPECQCDIRGIARIDEASGSRGCDQETGQCSCKRNVIGKDCNQCAEQHYGLSEDDAQGCQVSTKTTKRQKRLYF